MWQVRLPKFGLPRHKCQNLSTYFEKTLAYLCYMGNVSARFKQAMVKVDFATREKLVHLLMSFVILYPDKAQVKENISVTNFDALTVPPIRAAGFLR